jgi:hypothetical protein
VSGMASKTVEINAEVKLTGIDEITDKVRELISLLEKVKSIENDLAQSKIKIEIDNNNITISKLNNRKKPSHHWIPWHRAK